MTKKVDSFAPHNAQPVKGQALKKEKKISTLAHKTLSLEFEPKPLKANLKPKGAAKTNKFFFSALKKQRAA